MDEFVSRPSGGDGDAGGRLHEISGIPIPGGGRTAIHIPRGTIRIYFYDGTAAGSVGGSGGDGSELLERASGWSDPVATDVAEDSDNPGDCAGGRVFRKTPCVRSGNSGGAGWIGDNRRVIDGAGSSDASLQRFQ